MMINTRRAFGFLCVVLLLGVYLSWHRDSTVVAEETNSAPEKKDDTFAKTVRPFLDKYCVRCHGATRQKAERRFDRLTGAIDGDNTLVDLQDALDQLNLGQMPPKTARQPSVEERRAVVGWLTKNIAHYHQVRKKSGHGTVLRRLNAREYRNSIRDLLHLDVTAFDPTIAFPRDQINEHLDNVGETLVMSGHLLNRYLSAAEKVIDKAMSPLTKPEVQTWTFRNGFRQQPEIDQVHRTTNRFEWMTLYDVIGADKHEGAYGPILAFKKGVPFDGFYEIRMHAEALNRLHPFDDKFIGTDQSEPLRLGIVPGDYLAGPLHKPQPIEPLLAEIDLEDKQKWYTVRVWLNAGQTPRFTFINGLMDVRNLWAQLVRRYPKQIPTPQRRGIVGNRFNSIKFGKIPQIRIHEIEIKGPFYDTWPRKSQRALLGDDWTKVQKTGTLTEEQMRKHLKTFASRAYRRPVKDEELDRIMKVIAIRQKAGRTPLQAYSDGLKVVLCSPSFLYLQPTSDNRLSSYALASRLSYFLWGSMPDQELIDLAANEKLQKREVLLSQVDRMLKSSKSDAFIEGFLDSWLTLRDLGSMPPERRQFRAYYHYDLGSAMRRETHLFTRHLIDKNLSVVNFLDSDFTFVNRRLAEFYGMDPPREKGFHRVKVKDRRRGGLLGQASVLTVTANGIDTSPVVRGVWLLENVLGTPPSPPPPDVEPLDPDLRGAKTIRDQLKKHRSVSACNDCHRRIDPLGFALENFDPIGGWRTSYGRRGANVDASGELPNGKSFTNVVGLKKILVDQKEQFARALTEKMLAYATGRTLELSDRPEIDRIVKELSQRGLGMRDLIRMVVTSKTFQSK